MALVVPDMVAVDLRRCLVHFRSMYPWIPAADDLASVAALYIRYPALAVLLNCCGAGTLPLCGASAVFGCTLSFAVGTYVRAVGRRGAAVAASTMGIRCLVTIPCFLSLASPVSRFGKSLHCHENGTMDSDTDCEQRRMMIKEAGKQRKSAGQRKPASCRQRLLLWGLLLLIGIAADLLFMPELLQWTFLWAMGEYPLSS